MTVFRLFTTIMCILFFLLIELWADQTYFIRDIWTNIAISDAKIRISNETIVSDEQGSFRLNILSHNDTIISIKKDGYFTLSIKPDDLTTPFIYLTPVESTSNITVVRHRKSDKSLRLPSYISRIVIDHSQINSKNNIANLLAEQNGIFVKSYGPVGQIQSISIRGMSPEQTQILFDGVPMNNLQLGSGDLSYYPLQSIGLLDIYRGGNALFGGSGSIGGTIDIHPNPLFYDIGYDLFASYNSLDAFSFNGSVDLPIKSYRQRIFINHSKALNKYTTDYEDRSVALKNRDYQQISFGYQNAVNVSKHLTLNGFLSGLQRESGSPEAFIDPDKEQENVARTKIANYLSKIRLDYNVQGFGLHLQGYYRDEQMEYKDTSLVINFEPLHSNHKNQETGLQFRTHYLLFDKAIINSGIENAWQKIKSTDAGEHLRQRIAFYMLGDYEIFSQFLSLIRSVNLNGTFRYEYFSNYGSVFLPGLGINIQGQHWQVYVTGSQNYRIPTFNELYWRPGGNSDLEPEKSINIEGGIEYGRNISQILTFDIHTAIYQNKVEDQIKWLPGASVWTPQNISEVLSRGLEIETSFSDMKSIHRIVFNYRYGISEKHRAEFAGDNTAGNQLPYLPREQWNLKAKSGWRSMRFGINYSGVSFRYKTIQNKTDQILPAYSVLDSWIGLDFDFNKYKIRLLMSIENLFNKDYEVMYGYPMPLRNYTFRISSRY